MGLPLWLSGKEHDLATEQQQFVYILGFSPMRVIIIFMSEFFNAIVCLLFKVF